MHLERLEQRLPLAGDVTATLTGSTLRLAGDVTVQKDVRIFTGSQGEDSVSFCTVDDGGTVTVRGNAIVNTGNGGDLPP